MKALLIGDIHIDNSKSSIANSDSFHEIFQTFGLIKETIYNERPDYVIFFGDVFNSPYSITTPVITIISKLIGELAEETPLLFIVGNHDDVDERLSKVKIGDRYLNMRASLLTPFSNFNNVKVFESPSVVKIQDGVEIAFIPFSNSILDDVKNVEHKFTKGVKKILMGHFDVLESEHIKVKDESVITNPTAVQLIKDYHYDMALLGHVHDIHDFNIDNKLVKYIGSCRNVDFRNVGETKGIYILDFDTLSLKFIENKFSTIYKIFKTFSDFKDYIGSSDPEKLSKTKIRYIYNSSSEVKEIAKLKSMFKGITFQKNVAGLDSQNVDSKVLAEIESLASGELITKDNLVEYATAFKAPSNMNHALDTLNLMLKMQRK